MKRKIIPIIAGLVTAVVTLLIAETINANLHPAPTALNFKDSVAVKIFYENEPLSLWLLVLAGWLSGSLLCGFFIKFISKSDNKKLPIIAGFILTLSTIANFFSLPHPTWFIIVGLLIFVPSTLLGNKPYKINPNGQ